MFMLIVEFEIQPVFSDRFNIVVEEQAKNSLDKEKYCHFFAVTRGQKNNNIFILSEVYEDSQAFENHLTSRHFIAFDKQVSEWVIKKSVRSLE